MSRLTCLSMLMVLWGHVACNSDDEDRFEQITKLRAIGVGSSPVVSQLTTSISAPSVTSLTIYAAVPLGQTVTTEPYSDPQTSAIPSLAVQVVPGSEQYRDYAAFRVFSVNARVTLPAAQMIPIPPKPGFVRLKYGVLLKAGDEEEKIVGNLIVYPVGSPELAWQAPTAEIIAPSGGTLSESSIDLKADVASSAGENLRVGWFVSSGKVSNRRAKETRWQEPKSGTQTIMVTVRGLKSGGFAPPKVMDVVIP